MAKITDSLAYELHKAVPPNWYYQSLKVDLLQNYWHRRRFNEVRKVILKVEGEVLDIGCADGMFTKEILDKTGAKKVIAMDILKSSVNWAKKHWKNNKRMQFVVGDAHDLKYKNQYFDAVFALEVLEHVENPKRVLREIRRILKIGGYGIFLVPSDNFLFRIVWYLWLHYYPRGWVWRDTHIQTYRNNFLVNVCKDAGFKVEISKKFNLGMLHLVRVRRV